MIGNYTRTTDATVEPLIVEEVKRYTRIDTSDEDAVIRDLIKSARQWCEEWCERAFITQTWTATFDGFPSNNGKLELEWPKLISITTFSYTDTAEDSQTLTEGTDFTKSTSGLLGLVRPKYSLSWPTPLDDADSISIVYTAGYGATAASVPQPIKQAMALLVGHWFENREAAGTVSQEIAFSTKALLMPYKVHPT
jgi:uncharacterized phiE125 gp8 family phage protein